VCSLRDLLVTGRITQQRFDDRAQELCDRYFDLVLVHADPALAALDESFRPATPLRTPVEYTGFIRRSAGDAPRGPRSGVVVSAGGGLVGEPVYRLAVDAHRRSWTAHGLHTTIVAGPFAPRPVLDWLNAEASAGAGLTVVSHVPDLRPLLGAAAASVSQCGYNTALDLIAAQVPAIVLPYGDERENEQRRRAERLEARGVLRCAPFGLTADALAADVLALIGTTPSSAGLMLDGLEVTARVLSEYLERRAMAAVAGGGRR
ncbi:MAG: glycosyltransferase, partial [Vicinamibacterales bacterium]